MDKTTLEQIVEEEGYETRSYSGRGMGGEQCLAVIVPKGDTVFRMMETLIDSCASLNEDEIEELSQIVGCGRSDQLGEETIVYFPDWAHSSETAGRECEDEETAS